MFSDVTINPSPGSGLDKDAKLSDTMLKLAKRRNIATNDTNAAFQESDRERKFATESRVVGQ